MLIICGADYDIGLNFKRLIDKGLSKKHAMAIREFSLSLEYLDSLLIFSRLFFL